MLNNNGPSIEPLDIPKSVSNHAPYELLLLLSAFCMTNRHELILKQAK